MVNQIRYDKLQDADLIIDCVYESSRKLGNNIAAEPLNKLLKCGNQGGFRYRGSTKNLKFQYVILTSSLNEVDWPDSLDEESGRFVYYGDNRTPGFELHNTRKKGNIILKKIFDDLHLGKRKEIPPIFIFTKGAEERDMIFRGIAVPGAVGLSQTEDLIAIWKSNKRRRFQNYRAIFTILNIPMIKREWINDLIEGYTFSDNCSNVWKEWVEKGKYSPLSSPRVKKYRDKDEQLPNTKTDKDIIKTIHTYFKEKPHSFEKCAAEITRMMDINVTSYDLTKPSRDGGRDAVGVYRIGLENNSINVDFALEAKLYGFNNSVGVGEMSRLISRLRHRQFGVIVTTSFFGKQVYEEIIEDQHPVILISAIDIVKILKNAGIDTKKKAIKWLKNSFPLDE